MEMERLMTRGAGNKLTKSVVFNTEADAEVLAWLEEQRGKFTEIVRAALYAAMEADQAGPDQGLELEDIRAVVREELQHIALAPAGAPPPPARPDAGETIDAELKAQLLGAF